MFSDPEANRMIIIFCTQCFYVTLDASIQKLLIIFTFFSFSSSNLQSSDLLSSLSKSKSSGRRTKSRWEPAPEEKLVEKPEPVTNDLAKVASWSRPEATERAVNLFSSQLMIGSFMFFLL